MDEGLKELADRCGELAVFSAELIKNLGLGQGVDIRCGVCEMSVKAVDDRGFYVWFMRHHGRHFPKLKIDGREYPIPGSPPTKEKEIMVSLDSESPAPKSEVQDHIEGAEPPPAEGQKLQESLSSGTAEEIDIENDFEDETYIKVFRKLKKNPIYKDSESVHLCLHLLLSANYKPNKFLFNGKEVTVKRGQLITGRKQISAETGISESTVKRRLKLFEKLGILTIKSTNKFSIITLCNYKHYQDSNFENWPAIRTTVDGSQRPIKRPATDHQLTTIKEFKERKNKNPYVEGDEPLRLAALLLTEIRKNKCDFKGPANIQAWAKEFDLMIRRDGRPPERIEQVIQWVQSDHGDGKGSWRGWASNILSPGKLRQRYDELELKMEAASVGRKQKSIW